MSRQIRLPCADPLSEGFSVLAGNAGRNREFLAAQNCTPNHPRIAVPAFCRRDGLTVSLDVSTSDCSTQYRFVCSRIR
jgi:hypothetical protein